MDVEHDNANYGSRGWQLDKLQRVKLRDSQQNDKPLKEVYSWVLNKKRPEPRIGASKKTGTMKRDRNHENWSVKEVMETLGSLKKSLSYRRVLVL